MSRAIATIAVWAAPTVGAWATSTPEMGYVFVLSFFATIAIWGGH